MDFVNHGPHSDYTDIFVQLETGSTVSNSSNGGATSLVFKRRASDSVTEHHNGGGGGQDWNDYVASQYPPAKRLHTTHNTQSIGGSGSNDVRGGGAGSDGRITSVFGAQPTVFEYPISAGVNQSESGFLDKVRFQNSYQTITL